MLLCNAPGLLWWCNLGTDPVDQSAPVSGVVGNVGFETCGRLKGEIDRTSISRRTLRVPVDPPARDVGHPQGGVIGALRQRLMLKGSSDPLILRRGAWRIGPVQLQTRLPCGRGARRVCGWLAYLAATIRVGTQPRGLKVPRRRSAVCVWRRLGKLEGPHRHR